MSDSRNGNPLFVQGTEPQAEEKAFAPVSPKTDADPQESAKSKAHNDVAALQRSARSDLSNAASALSAASAVAVLEKEADKASMAVNTEEEQAQKQRGKFSDHGNSSLFCANRAIWLCVVVLLSNKALWLKS